VFVVPQQSSLRNAQQNVKEEQEEEAPSTSQATAPHPLLSPSAHTSKAEDDEVAAINRNSASSANQRTASFKATNEGSSSRETRRKEELDVSRSPLPASPANSPEDNDKILEVQGVKIKMNTTEPEGSLYSINPFAIPTSYLKPFERNPGPIARLDNEELDKILVEQKSRKGSGPMPMSCSVKMERDE
jgi:hypothetical protein